MRSRREKSEGARDAGVRRTHGLRHLATPKQNGDPAKDRRPSVETNRKSAEPSAPRARCLRLAPHDPRWAEFSEPLRWCGRTGSTHRCEPSTAPGRWHGVTALPPSGSVSPTRGDGTVRLGPPEPGCASPHPGLPATASRPASETLDQTPLGWGGTDAWLQVQCGGNMIIILLTKLYS